MAELLRDLVRIPSESGKEGAVAALITDYCFKYGLEPVTVDEAGNVLIQLGTEDGPTLLYDAHMDTVSPPSSGWAFPPYEGVINDGVLYGMGASVYLPAPADFTERIRVNGEPINEADTVALTEEL